MMPAKSKIQIVAEPTILFLICALILSPLAATAIYMVAKVLPEVERRIPSSWMQKVSLAGMEAIQAPPSLSFDSVMSARLQSWVSEAFNKRFVGREALVRWTSELYYRAFNVSTSKSAELVLGKDDFLFEMMYLKEYFLERPEKEDILKFTRDIAKFQRICESRKIPFTLLLTPSKASIMPGMAPEPWASWYDDRPRSYELLRDSLKRAGIHFVDGHELTKAQISDGVPTFAKGGTHWTTRTAFRSSQEVVNELIRQGAELKPLTANLAIRMTPHWSKESSDSDLFDLMNIVTEWTYPCGVAEIDQVESTGKKLRVVLVGGSFTYMLGRQLRDSNQFSSLPFYFYYKVDFSEFVTGSGAPGPHPLDFERDIFSADCIILELNEQIIGKPNHIRAFLKDAFDSVAE